MDKQTITTYNKLAREYDEETSGFWDEFPVAILDEFTQHLDGNNVLNAGSGPGRDSLLLQKRGLNITCLDASPEMVQMCTKRGFSAVEGDLLSLPFKDAAFGGVWSYTALLHLRKTEIHQALKEIYRILSVGGVLGLGMIEGDEEKYRESSGVNLPRWFAHYTKKELESLLENSGFKVVYFEIFKPKSKNYLNFICIKK